MIEVILSTMILCAIILSIIVLPKDFRIGNWVWRVKYNKTEHARFGRFIFGKVADTKGILNTVGPIQMFFADYDTSNLSDILTDLDEMSELIKMKIGDLFLFKSIMQGKPDHFFVISPFQYQPIEIRVMLALSKLIDPKFVAVYMRDGVNAIRLIPKHIGKDESRKIEFIIRIPFNSKRTAVRGMCSVLQNLFPELDFKGYKLDGTIPEDLIVRTYETIRW